MNLVFEKLPLDDLPTQQKINESLFETIQFSIFCFTFPFYIFIIFFILHAQYHNVCELSTSFFKLCISTSVLDLWTLITNYLGAKFPKWGWATSIYLFFGDYYAKTYMYFAWSTAVCQSMTVSILATNRLSVLICQNNYSTFWNRKRLYLAIFLQFAPGLLIGLLTFTNETRLFRNHRNGLVAHYLNRSLSRIYFIIGFFFLLSNCSYIIVSYVYLFVFLRKRNRVQAVNLNSIRIQKFKIREIKLFAMISITVGIQLCLFLLTIIKATVLIQISSEDFYVIYNAISDLSASINPYLLWIFSDCLRKYILQQIGKKATTFIISRSLMTNYFGAMFPKWGWGLSIYISISQFYAPIYLYFSWVTGFCQAMSVSIIAANRLSAMIFPNKYRKIWNGRNLYIAIGIQFVPGCIVGLMTFYNSSLIYRNNTNGIVAKFSNKNLTNFFFTIGGAFLLINCLYLIIAYFFLFYVLRKKNVSSIVQIPNRCNGSYKQIRMNARNREAKLFIMSTITVGIQLIFLLLLLIYVFRFIELTSDQFHMLYNAMTDLYASVNPYLLWIFSDSLRKYILIQMGLRKDLKMVASVTPMTKQ